MIILYRSASPAVTRAIVPIAPCWKPISFFVGSRAGGHVTHFWRFPAVGTPVIQLDINPSELGRNYPNTISIFGDAKVALQRMIDVAQPEAPEATKAWIGRVQELVATWRSENEPHRNSDAVPIRPGAHLQRNFGGSAA